MANPSWHNSSGVSNVSFSEQTLHYAQNITPLVLLDDFQGFKKNKEFAPIDYKLRKTASKGGLEVNKFIVVKGKGGVDVEIPFKLLKTSDSIRQSEDAKGGKQGVFIILRTTFPFYKNSMVEGILTKDGKSIIANDKSSNLTYKIPNYNVDGIPTYRQFNINEISSLGASLSTSAAVTDGDSKPTKPPKSEAPEIAKSEVKTETTEGAGIFENKKLVYGVIGVIAVIGIISVLKYKKVI